MQMLTERFELRLSRQTMHTLRQQAEQRGVSAAQLVREAIDQLIITDQAAKLRAAEKLFQIEAPVGPWEEMKKEIENAHLAGLTDE